MHPSTRVEEDERFVSATEPSCGRRWRGRQSQGEAGTTPIPSALIVVGAVAEGRWWRWDAHPSFDATLSRGEVTKGNDGDVPVAKVMDE